ncbi:hypothetical protein AAVH_22555 [Aphelenchoides avenae]|nr:hypothetical protein AAVH_22555 [Aphelenchus avenae]
MSGTEKPRQRTIARLTASISKAYAYATTGTSAGAQPGPEGLSDRPTVTEQELRQMGVIKHFPNENAEETRRAHFEYLEDKKKEFTNLLLRLKTEKDGLEADEAELVHRQWWAARQKETLTRDFENFLNEERMAMHAQVKKKPQEVEAERDGGEPNLQAQIELLDEAKRKVLVSLREVEDEEIGNLDEGEELRTKREELTRRTKETEQKLTSVEQTLLQVSRAIKEQEAAQSVSKEPLGVQPVEHDSSTRKRTAPEACEESQPKKANVWHGLEEEETEDDEEEEHVHQREKPAREKQAVITNEQKSSNISQKPNCPVQAEEGIRERDGNASEPRAAAGPATHQSSTSTSSATRDDREPFPSGTRISLDELEQAIANMDFQRDDENKIRASCPYCDREELCGRPKTIFMHLITHLHIEHRAYHCSQDGCNQTSVEVTHMRKHFESRHKELTWNDENAKQCEVAPNLERLNAIKRLLTERTGRFREKLSFDELEERVKTSTLKRCADGIYTLKCSVCHDAMTRKVKCGRAALVDQHLRAHLAPDCVLFTCPARGCKHATARLPDLKDHFLLVHKELKWTAEVEEKSAVTENVKRLEAVVQIVLAANPVPIGLSLDDLEAQAGNCTYTRNAKGFLSLKCSVCNEQISVTQSGNIRQHLVSHLHQSSLPLRCLEDGCQHMSYRVEALRKHMPSVHGGKELTKSMEKDCEVLDNKKQLDAIVADLYARRPPKPSSCSNRHC